MLTLEKQAKSSSLSKIQQFSPIKPVIQRKSAQLKKEVKIKKIYKPEEWRYFRTLGSGSFGTVRKCILRDEQNEKTLTAENEGQNDEEMHHS